MKEKMKKKSRGHLDSAMTFRLMIGFDLTNGDGCGHAWTGIKWRQIRPNDTCVTWPFSIRAVHSGKKIEKKKKTADLATGAVTTSPE